MTKHDFLPRCLSSARLSQNKNNNNKDLEPPDHVTNPPHLITKFIKKIAEKSIVLTVLTSAVQRF